MSRSLVNDFREYADVLAPRSLHQFLAVQAWTLHSQMPFMETWVHADSPGRASSIVHLPRDHQNVDFDRRLAEAAARVARAFDWSISELAEQVANVHADIFYIRVRSSGVDGTIALWQASSTIDAIEKMVKSAAIITSNPRAKGTGRTSERVSSFLSNDLRMGHTRRGSFIITVAARLQDTPTALLGELTTPESPTGARAVVAPIESSHLDTSPQHVPDSEIDFTRRVMTTLSHSLAATSRHLRQGEDFIDLETAKDQGMTVPIVESLGEIAGQRGHAGLDLKFEWSPVLEQQTEVAEKIVFAPSEVERIPVTIERMKRHTEPGDVVSVVGPVVTLSRDENDSAESGEVHVLADVGGSVRKVGIDLVGVAYDWAIYAHRHHLPFSAQGVLDKVGNRWKIVDRLAVDTTYLQRIQADRIERLTGERSEPMDGPAID